VRHRSRPAATVLVALVAIAVAVTLRVRPTPTRPARPARPVTGGSGLPASPPAPNGGHAGPSDNEVTAGVPTGRWSLPGPSRYEGLAGVGYPDTTLGAVALGYSALAARFTTDPDMAVSVVRATALAPTPTFLEEVAQGTEALRTRFGLAPIGATPTTIGLSLIGCRVATASSSRVVAGYEGTLSVAGGSVQGMTAEVSVAIVLVWDGADWKIDPRSDLPTPAIEFPTSSGATTSGGWHVCSEA
jgi:hypothetical protein